MRVRLKLALLLFIGFLLLAEPCLAISKARFIDVGKLGVSPSLIAALDSKVAVYDPSKPSLSILDPGSGEVREVSAPADLSEIEPLDGKVYGVSWDKPVLYAFDEEGFKDVGLPAPARAVYPSEEAVWLCIPDKGLVLGLDPQSLGEKYRFKAPCAAGRQMLSEAGGLLWIVSQDYRTVVRIDVASGDRAEKKLDADVVAVAAYGSEAFVALSSDEVVKLDKALAVTGSWKLPEGLALKIYIHPLGSRRLVYAAYSRWRIGEIDGSSLMEVSTNGTAEYAAPGGDRIWFILPNKGELGWSFYSRPPRILEFRVEKSEGGFKAVARIDDPDGDLSKVVLALMHPPRAEGLPPKVDRYEMRESGGEWAAEFALKQGEKVEAYVEAYDEVGNVGKSGAVEVYKEAATASATFTGTTTAQTSPSGSPISGYEVYLAGSSLLLLIPIAFAILLRRSRRTKRRRRK